MGIKISNQAKEYLFSVLYGVVIVANLLFSLLAINEAMGEGGLANVFFFLVFLTLSISRVLLGLYEKMVKKSNTIAFVKNVVFASIYLITSILILALLNVFPDLYRAVSVVYLSTIIANRVCLICEKKRLRSTIFNIILSAMAALLAFVIAFGNAEDGFTYFILLVTVIIVISFAEVLAFSFSKIQLKGLLNIIRKTYVLEIIYGLVLLTVSFSFYFMLMEEKIETFGDGLWYSFAIITTIGFGDMYATSVIGRILSVILGIYGIIVVASITSVIVNFYNEVKNDDTKIEEKKEEKSSGEENPEEKETDGE